MRRYRGKKGKGHQETCIKYPWTKPKGGRIEGGRCRWVGSGRVVGEEWRQLYSNNNKKRKEKKKEKNLLPSYIALECYSLS